MLRIMVGLLLILSALPVMAQDADEQIRDAQWKRQLRVQHDFLTLYAEEWARALPRFRSGITARGQKRLSVMNPRLKKLNGDYGDANQSKYPGLHSEMIIEILKVSDSGRLGRATRSIGTELERINTLLDKRSDPVPVDEETLAAFGSLAGFWDVMGRPRDEVTRMIDRMTAEE